MFPILLFALLLWTLHVSGILFPIVICLGLMVVIGILYLVVALAVFFVYDSFCRLFNQDED